MDLYYNEYDQTYEGDDDDYVDNSPLKCSSNSVSAILQSPISMMDSQGKRRIGVTSFFCPYERNGETKYTIECYLFSEFKTWMMDSSPPLFFFDRGGADESRPLLNLNNGMTIECNYYLLLRYSTFLLHSPYEIPTGSIFGVGTHHGVRKTVYKIKPIATDYLNDLNNENMIFSKPEDFSPGNQPPYNVTITKHDDDFIEQEVTDDAYYFTNLFLDYGMLYIGINDLAVITIETKYGRDDSGYYLTKRKAEIDIVDETVEYEGRKIIVNKKGKNNYDLHFTRNNEKWVEHIKVETPLLNPEFATPNFIPDPNKEYYCNEYLRCKGFNYLQALVMSGNKRIHEFNHFAENNRDEFEKQAKHQNYEGWTALMLAARNSNNDSSEKMVELLIPVSDAKKQDSSRFTALMYAAEFSNITSTERTVEMLIPVSDVKQQNNYGWTALALAIYYSDTSTEKTVEMLIPVSDATQQNKFGWTPLMIAARNSNTDSTERTVEMLIPVSDPKQQDNEGMTALMHATRFSNESSSERTVEMLIPVSDATQQDNDGWTALMLSAANTNNGSTERTVEMLIPVSNPKQQNNDGATALILAARYSNKNSTEKTVEMLIPVSNATQQDNEGRTALMYAARYSETDSSERTVEMLIPVSDVKRQDSVGWTALMYAARYSNDGSSERTVKMLIPVSDVNRQDNYGVTALMYAARYSNDGSSERTVEMLIPVSDTKHQNKKGWTALMYAARYSNDGSSERTVEMLIPVSDTKHQNKKGMTALMLAKESGADDNVIQMLS